MKKILNMFAVVLLTVAMIGQFSCSGEATVVPDVQDSLVLLKKEMKEQMIAVQKPL